MMESSIRSACPFCCFVKLGFVAYFAFLLARNLPTALALFAISLLQALPPILTKGFAQQNYSDTRDIEADITDLTLELYHGFDTIKMFGLKQWCLDRLAGLHRDYLKIGNRSEATATAEDMLSQLIGNILTYGTYGLMGWFILQGYAELDAGVEAIALSGGLTVFTATILRQFADSVFRLDFTLSARSAAALEHDRMVLGRFLDKRYDSVLRYEAGDIQNRLDWLCAFLRESGKTVVFISHDDRLTACADNVVILQG